MSLLGVVPDELTLEEALERMLPRQREFLGAEEPFCAYVGGVGSGKTVALCMNAILRGESTPGGLSLLGRLNVPALKDTTRRTFLSMFPNDWCADWRETENRLVAKNGHEYLFRHLDLSDAAVKAHIRSLNLSAFYVDEASEISQQSYLTLIGRLRRHNVPMRVGRIVSNPAGRDWMWKQFFDSNRSPKLAKMHRGITAPTTENTNLPSDYTENLLAVYPSDWAERFIFGSFADFTDKVYKDWDYRIHVWDAAKEWEFFNGRPAPPDDWPVIVGIDIGGVDPWAIVFIAVHPETGMLFLFDEIYQSGILARDIADRFWSAMGQHHFEGMAYDYENQQAALELAEEGVPGTPANKDVTAGVFKLGKYLHPDRRLVHPFLGDGTASPRLFVSSACQETIRSITSHAWERDRQGNFTGKPADDDHKHVCDALRYAVHTFRPDPRPPKKKELWENTELDEMSRMFWRDVGLREKRKLKQRTRPVFGWGKMVV